MRTLTVTFLLLCVVATSVAQDPGFKERYPRYRVQRGDVLAFNFAFTPEFNQTAAVQPDGYVTLREIGDVRVQDKTTAEIVEAVRTSYAKVLNDPVITVE